MASAIQADFAVAQVEDVWLCIGEGTDTRTGNPCQQVGGVPLTHHRPRKVEPRCEKSEGRPLLLIHSLLFLVFFVVGLEPVGHRIGCGLVGRVYGGAACDRNCQTQAHDDGFDG